MGYFIGTRPGFLALKQKVQELWSIKGLMDMFSLLSGFLLFRFGGEEDKLSVLERGPLFVFGQILILKAWSPNSILEKIDFTPYLSLHSQLPSFWWSPGIVGQIASAVGLQLLNPELTFLEFASR